MGSHYLQQLVGEVGQNQPVVQCDVEELVLGPLGQAEDLFKLDADTALISNGLPHAATSSATYLRPPLLT